LVSKRCAKGDYGGGAGFLSPKETAKLKGAGPDSTGSTWGEAEKKKNFPMEKDPQ